MESQSALSEMPGGERGKRATGCAARSEARAPNKLRREFGFERKLNLYLPNLRCGRNQKQARDAREEVY